ncbi:MAG: glycosyltransferase family 2 protein [Calditrichaeota bacterium]|nr:glycosyltransferase family 2 protein [Calditrichota bacterium]
MTGVEIGLFVFYGLVLFLLVVFGLHKYFLLFLYWKYKDKPVYKAEEVHNWPRVTVQLPIYNEKYVIRRLLEAVCAFDYPRVLLEIQVLDDSTDETQRVIESLVEKYRRQKVDITYIHRTHREGFKAGALANGMRVAKGEFLAIFDADFVPQPDFLKKTLGYFKHAEIGMVQTRWGHINRDYSLLTRIQSLFLDGHFVIEHVARNRSGRFFNFNGTAGIWRKQAILDAGGWQHDTLTEDLDLSYRAQLAGWKFIYLPDVVSPAELPVEINAYKMQQHRWAKGSIQTAKKLLPVIFKSNFPFFVKMEASVHLFSNFTYLFMTIPSILMPIILHVQLHRGWAWMAYLYLFVFFSSSLSVMIYYLVSQREGGGAWRGQIRYLPFLMSIGIGLSINNARAVLEAIFNHVTEFKRTPKYQIEKEGDNWQNKKYRTSLTLQPVVELLLAAYFTVSLVSLVSEGLLLSIPFFILFQVGFLYIGLLSVFQSKNFAAPMNSMRLFFQRAVLLVLRRF